MNEVEHSETKLSQKLLGFGDLARYSSCLFNNVSMEPPPVEAVAEVSDAPVVIGATSSEERGDPLDDVASSPRSCLRVVTSRVRSRVCLAELLLRVAHWCHLRPRRPSVQPITTLGDEEEIAKVEDLLAELFMRSLVGSYREGTVRCIMDLAETYPDRPAGMYDLARGRCRSLSEDPKRKGEQQKTCHQPGETRRQYVRWKYV